MPSVSLAKRKHTFSPFFAVADIGSRLSIKKALATPAGLTKYFNMDIENLMNNPNFKLDLGQLLVKIRVSQLNQGYHLKSILRRQIQILELHKGKTGQELDDAVQSEIERLNSQYSDWLKEDWINDVNDLSLD